MKEVPGVALQKADAMFWSGIGMPCFLVAGVVRAGALGGGGGVRVPGSAGRGWRVSGCALWLRERGAGATASRPALQGFAARSTVEAFDRRRGDTHACWRKA